MVRIEPFRGWLLNDPGQGPEGSCAAPPYDVITDDEREQYAARSSANIVHLTLPREAHGLDRYAAARVLLEQMLADGRLIRDEQPCYYLQDVRFQSPGGESVVRRGLIGLVPIEPIGPAGGGTIRGHENVQPRTVEDRQQLLRATLANLEPLIFLYSDPSARIDALLEDDRARPPLDRAEFQELCFELRRADAGASRAIQSALEGQPLYIADGHHRFTVAQRFMKERPELPGSSHRLALLVRAEDPGVIVLPTHRFVHELSADASQALIERLEQHFELEPIEASEFLSRLDQSQRSGGFGVWLRRENRALLATPGPSARAALSGIPEPLGSLDVTLLHGCLLEASGLGHSLECEYVRGEQDPIGRAQREDVPLAFFLSAPGIETILRVSDQGLSMPTKSTYFYPKAASGQVLFRLDQEF